MSRNQKAKLLIYKWLNRIFPIVAREIVDQVIKYFNRFFRLRTIALQADTKIHLDSKRIIYSQLRNLARCFSI